MSLKLNLFFCHLIICVRIEKIHSKMLMQMHTNIYININSRKQTKVMIHTSAYIRRYIDNIIFFLINEAQSIVGLFTAKPGGSCVVGIMSNSE
jgi:hypothetical protein